MTNSSVTFTTRNRKLEQFLYLHGIDYVSWDKDDDGMTVWTYKRTPEVEHIAEEFRIAAQRRELRGA